VVAIGTPAVAFGAHLDQLRMLALPGIGPLLTSIPASAPESMFGRMMAANMGRHAVDTAPDLVRAAHLAQRRAGFGKTVSTYLQEMFNGARSKPPRYILSAAELAQIQQPVLIVWGQDDDHYQLIADAKSKAALISNARFEVRPGRSRALARRRRTLRAARLCLSVASERAIGSNLRGKKMNVVERRFFVNEIRRT